VSALVLVLTGTDHHRFDRIVDWVDVAAARHRDVRFVVQYGASRLPTLAVGYAFLTHERLTALLAEASVVVCHGGPGTIMDARELGHVPVCVPRDPARGEHVDGHQQRFAALVAQAGVVRLADSLTTFERELEGALEQATVQTHTQTHTLATPAREAARTLAASELESLIAVRPHRLGRLHRTRPAARGESGPAAR
jgi:UDP-N-acetylglucosamine transferase subunit ALG13